MSNPMQPKQKASLFMRKPNVLPGYQVTLEDMEFIASWCDGDIRGLGTDDPYIRIHTDNPSQDRSRYEAHLGQWIVRLGKGYSVYAQRYIDKNFLDIPNDVNLDDISLNVSVQMSTRLVQAEDAPPAKPIPSAQASGHSCCQHTHAPANVRPNVAPARNFGSNRGHNHC